MNIKKLINYQKLISVITAICLLVSFVIGPAAASAINNEQTTKEYNQIFKEFILPYSYGKITNSHFAGTDRVIINIQDLHCHPKVQKNIANIIDVFDKKFGVKKVYLEGAYGDVSTKWLADKAENNKQIIEQMLDTGRLTGAEYYSALSGKTEIIKGLEEKEPYLDNIVRLGNILQNQEKISLILEELSLSVNEVKKKYYTKRQYKLEKLFKEYKEGKINSQKYYTLLSKHIDRLGIDLSKYENTLIYLTLLELQKNLNYKQTTKELQSLIYLLKQKLPYSVYKSLLDNTSNFKEVERFYSYIVQLDKIYSLNISLNFTELDKYFRYVELSKKINPVELVKEDEFLEQEINTRFSQTKAQQDVVFLVYFEKYLKDYLTTKITLDDYKYYQENIGRYVQVYNKYVDNRVLSLLDEYIEETDKFYSINLDRNTYFTKNIFEEKECLTQIENTSSAHDDINKIIDNMQQVKELDIVVTGGFHSQTVTELLEKENVSYIVITPNVTDGIKLAEETYYEIAKEQSKISFQTMAPVIASLSSQLQAILLNKIEGNSAQTEQIMGMNDEERAQIISELAAAKLLESDDIGAVEEKLQEIVEAIVGEKVTPELISQIKNLQKLLKDTEQLQKVVKLLSEKSSAKQSVILLSNMLNDIVDKLYEFIDENYKGKKGIRNNWTEGEKFLRTSGGRRARQKRKTEKLQNEIVSLVPWDDKFYEYIRSIEDREYLRKLYTILQDKHTQLGQIQNEYGFFDEDEVKKDMKEYADFVSLLKAKEVINIFYEMSSEDRDEIYDLYDFALKDFYGTNISSVFLEEFIKKVNNEGFSDEYIEFITDVLSKTHMISEFETRDNIVTFLSFSTDVQRKIFDMYKEFLDRLDFNALKFELFFIFLNKGFYSEDELEYLAILISGLNLKDKEYDKDYVRSFEKKEINEQLFNEFISDVDPYKLVAKYTMDLLFSDIDLQYIPNFNIQDLSDLFNKLKDYDIETLDVEDKALSIVVFFSEAFIQYCWDKDIEDIAQQYYLSTVIANEIYSLSGENIFDISLDKQEEIISRTLDYYDEVSRIASSKEVFSNEMVFISLHNDEKEKSGDLRFTPKGIKEIFTRLNITPRSSDFIEISFIDTFLDFLKSKKAKVIHKKILFDFMVATSGSVVIKQKLKDKIDSIPGSLLDIKDFIEFIEQNKEKYISSEIDGIFERAADELLKGNKVVILFDGHGEKDGFFYSENGKISVERMLEFLRSVSKQNGDLSNLTLMSSSCYSKDFIDNITYEHIIKGARTNPQTISDAGRETPFVEDIRIELDSGEKVLVSSLFYSLIKFLKSKSKEEIGQMKGRLTFRELADAPRYMSNHTISITNGEIATLRQHLERDIREIIGRDDPEEKARSYPAISKPHIYSAELYPYAQLLLPKTEEILDKFGNTSIIKKLDEIMNKLYKDKHKDISGENFKYTKLGTAIGVFFIESIPFWLPDFVKKHEDMTPEQKAGARAVVWRIKALSIGIGFGVVPVIGIGFGVVPTIIGLINLVNPLLTPLIILPSVIITKVTANTLHYFYDRKLQKQKYEEQKQKYEIEIDDREKEITILINKDGVEYSILFDVLAKRIYLNSIDGDVFFNGKDFKEVEALFGLEIKFSRGKLTIITPDNIKDVKIVKYNDVMRMVAKLQKQNIPEQENEQALIDETHSEGIEKIHLDMPSGNSYRISNAIRENKLLAIYPFSHTYDVDSLTDEELTALFCVIRDNIFQLTEGYFSSLPKIISYEPKTGNRYAINMNFMLEEFIKNAFVHGNLSDPSKPIYIKIDGDKFTVYNAVTDDTDTTVSKENKERRLTFSAIAGLSGVHKGLETVREYEKEGLVTVEQERELRIGTKKYFVISAEKGKKQKTSSTLMLPSTQETLDKWGNSSIIRKLYKDNAGENFKYTTTGLLIGDLLETFSFWKMFSININIFGKEINIKSFTEGHKNPTIGQKIVIWVIRILSAGAGIHFGVTSFGLGIFALFLTQTITHFIWNFFVVKIGRKDLLLQTSKEKSKTEVIIPSVEAKEQARSLTEEEKRKLKASLSRTKARIKNSTLVISEENDKNLALELQEVFNDLLDSMVKLGKITEAEKEEYELILYLSDEVNAFTVPYSKTVFISTGMLHSFSLYLQRIVMRGEEVLSEENLDLYGYSRYMNEKIKDLCKDHIAAILAHELQHTTQDKRIYASNISSKGNQKKNEYDSDIQAIFILDKAGYNPTSVQDVMEFLVFLEKKGGDNPLYSILDAHPNAENRLLKIKTFLSDRNIFLRNTANSPKKLESSIPYYGEENLRSDIIGEFGYQKRDMQPQDSNRFIKEILEKYGKKINLYRILGRFNKVKRFVDINDVLDYINSDYYPFFDVNDKIKNFSDEQKKVIIRLMNSFEGHYPSNAELYEICPKMDELKEIFAFIIEPENYFYFFEKISFLNISYLIAALHNSGNLNEQDYAKIQKFLAMDEDEFADYSYFAVNIDKDTIDFYIDKFDLFDNFKKYKLFYEIGNSLYAEKNFSESQKEKLRKFFFTPSAGGMVGYHMFRGSKFFELLYPETTFEYYVSSITEEQKRKILEEAEKKEIEDYNSSTRSRNMEVLGDAYDPSKEAPGVTSMYEIYKKSGFAMEKFKEKFGSRWDVPYEDREDNWHEIWDKKETKWLSENDDALFAEWFQNKKDKWFFDFCIRKYNSLMLEKYESDLFGMFNTLEEKLEFLFSDGIIVLASRFSLTMDYDKSIPKILKKEIDNIKSAEELFDFIDTIIDYFDKEKSSSTYFDKEKSSSTRDLNTTILNILLNVDREILNNFTIEDIQKLFELSISKEIPSMTKMMSVALIIKRKNPKSFDFGKIFSICDYDSKEHDKNVSDFVQNIMDREQFKFLLQICYEKDCSLEKILPYDAYEKIVEKFDETLSLEEKYRYDIYKDYVYPYNVYYKIKNNEELNKIPVEHLKRFLGVKIPIHKDSYMNGSVGRIGMRNSLALRIWQNKVESYRQKFGKSFYDTNSFNEFERKIKEIEDVFYPWKNRNADNQNEIFSNEVDMLWANLLHNMCGFGLNTKSFVFVNIHGEELLNVWCELTPNYDFVPTAQQTNELINAFVLIKKYLPKEQVVAYAKMLYEMISKNKELSVFESATKNLELLDFFFEGFSEIKDDYIYELLENYDIDINTYNECLSRTTYYSYRDETEDTGKNFLYRELAEVLSQDGMRVEEKIKLIAWLVSDKQEKPEFLKQISVKNAYDGDPSNNRTYLGEEAKVDIFRTYFWSMTKLERSEYIRGLISDILKEGVGNENYEILKNTLADAFFDSVQNYNNEKIVYALSMSFKFILDSLAFYENESTSERQILFISDLIDSLVSMSKANFSPEEKEARQIGNFIVAMGSASGVAVVKILQILSNSKAFEGLGEQGYIINEEISKVRSSNERLSKRVVFQQLEDLGILGDVESVGKCLGSASIGVTYLINMKDGTKRIIKIKRPSVLKNYEQDLNTAEKLIDYFRFYDVLPQQNKSMIPAIEFLRQVFNTELNFEIEVNNLVTAKENLSQTAINVPDIVGTYNSDSFMQTISSGQSFDNAKSLYSEQERAEIYSKILLEFFREVFMDGFFHADLHEGNIFVDENKNITFIDWGAVGKVEDNKRDELEAVFVSLLFSDSGSFIESLKQYDIDIYNKIKPKSSEITKILNSNDNLETKFGEIFTIFNQIDMSQNHDFLMFIQGLSKIAKYIDNLSVKEKILLLLDDTVIYDLLQNKQVLANIYSLLEKIVSDKYRKLIKYAVTKIVGSDEENLRDIIADFRLFIVNSDDDVILRRLVRNILKILNVPSAFENPLEVLISKKIKQLSDMSNSYLQRGRESVKEGKKSRFSVLDFIKKRFLKEAETQQEEIEFNEESDPIVFLIQKDGVQYSLTVELDSIYNIYGNDRNYIDVGIENKKMIVYLSTIGKESFSKRTSEYASIESIEELLGIKINISGHTVSVSSENAQTDIKHVKYEDIPQIISDLKGSAIESMHEEEAELLKDDSGCNGVETLFLDQDKEIIKTKIDSAIKDNKDKVLFALYPFSNIYDISSLSDKQKLALYLQISKYFEDIVHVLFSKEYFYRINSDEIYALKYSTLELIQEAFFSGNASLSKPIYVSCDYYSGTPTFTVYRKLGDETIDEKQKQLAAVVNTRSILGKTAQQYQKEKILTVTPQEKRIRGIGNYGKYYTAAIVKSFRYYYEEHNSWAFDLPDLDEEFNELFGEDIFGEEEEREETSLPKDKIFKAINWFQLIGQALDFVGNIIYKDKKAIENFRFTRLGGLLVAVLEFIPFWSPDFIDVHEFGPSVKPGMTAVVWVIRILTVVAGVVTGMVWKAVLANIILHYVWNRFVILIGRTDLLLQISKEKPKIEEITIPEQESKEEQSRALSQEEITNYEQFLQKTILENDTKYQYQPNPEIQKDIEEIFGKLLDAMVAQGKITVQEKQQYRIHYYYSPVANAYVVPNTRDVFIFSQLLYELAEEMKEEDKELTKDHIAAILAHELQHTVQKNKVYKKVNTKKGDGKRKEYDADRESIFILEQAGYNPRAVEETMTALSFMSDSGTLKDFLKGAFDEHPDTKNRLKEISEILEDPSLVFLSMTKEQQKFSSSVQKYGQDFQRYLATHFNSQLGFGYSLDGKHLQQILNQTEFFEQMSIFDMRKDIDFYNSSTKDFVFNNILNGNYKFFTKAENDFIKNCSDEEKEVVFCLLFPSSIYINKLIEKLENRQKKDLFVFCIDILKMVKVKDIENKGLLFYIVSKMNPTEQELKKFLDFRTNNEINFFYSTETVYFWLTNYKYLSDSETKDLLEKLMITDPIFDSEGLPHTFDNFSQEQKEESLKLMLKILLEKKSYYPYVSPTLQQHSMHFINFFMRSSVLTKQEKFEFLFKLSKSINNEHKEEFNNFFLNLFDELHSDKTNIEKILYLFEIFDDYYLCDVFSYDDLMDRYDISKHDFSVDELRKMALSTKYLISRFDVFFLGYFLKLHNKDIKIYFVKDEKLSYDKKYSDGICLYHGMDVEKLDKSLFRNVTLNDLMNFQNFMLENNCWCQNISCLMCFIAEKVLNLSDIEKIKLSKILTFLPKGQSPIEKINGDISSIPYEHLKNLVDMRFFYKDINEQTRELPKFKTETSFVAFYVPFLEFKTFKPNYSAVSFEKTVENIKKHFDAYSFFQELRDEENGEEEIKIFISLEDDIGNPDEAEQRIKNTEIEKAWLVELHRIFELSPKEKNVEFNYEGKQFVYTYFELDEQLFNDAFVPTAQQAQQLINAFSIIKRELPQETVDVYAKLVYSLLKRNSSLSVFSSAKDNLELLDLLFEDFSAVKDGYITELLDNYNVTVEEYRKLISKTRLYSFGSNSEKNNENVTNLEIINTILPTLSDSEKISFFFWLLSGNDSYKPQMLKQIRPINFDYEGEINFDSLRQSFRLIMTKTERENFIRKILLGNSGIIEKGKTTAEKNSKEFEQGLKNILFDDFFLSSFSSSKIKASSMSIVFKDVFSIVFNNLSDERKVLFVNNLISSLAEIKNSDEKDTDEQKARQLGKLIVALGASSGVMVVKLLQILSNNRVFEALDEKYGSIINEEVAKVKSENEPLSKSVLFQYLEKLGVSSAVEYVGKRLGSASIGITYLLKLKNMSELVVAKIKRPNINKNYSEDFKIADKILEYFKGDSSLIPSIYKKTLPSTDKLKTLFDEELEFEKESENLKTFNEQLKKRNSKIRVPQLVETVDGIKVYTQNLFLQTTAKGKTLDKIKVSKKQKSRIYFEILKEFFTEVFVDPIENGSALYHADLHTGNIFVDEQGNISFIDLGGVGNISAQQSKSLKNIFMYMYSGNYENFINALKSYNSKLYKDLEQANALKKTEEILNRKTSLESKFVDLFEIFNSLENIDSDFMMFIQAISKISSYLDNLGKKEQLLLLNNLSFKEGIQFKIISDSILTAVASIFKRMRFGKKQKEEESYEVTQDDMFREKLLSNYPDISSEKIDLLLSLDPFIMKYIKNNTVSLTQEQLIKGGILADKFYKQKIITKQNNKTNILFKILSTTDFSEQNIEKLLSLDENTIERIISEITENKKIEVLFIKAEQLNIELIYKNDDLSESRKFDRILMFAKGAKLNRSQNFHSSDLEAELKKANMLFSLSPETILKEKLLEDEIKLFSLYSVVKGLDLSLEEDIDIIEILAPFSVDEINHIESHLTTSNRKSKKDIKRFIYLYNDYRNIFSKKGEAETLSKFVENNENDEQIREFFDLAIKNKSIGTIKNIAYTSRSFDDIILSSEFALGIILFRCKALDIPIDENNQDFADMLKSLKNISYKEGQERISSLDEEIYKKLFSIRNNERLVKLLERISEYSYYNNYYNERNFEYRVDEIFAEEMAQKEAEDKILRENIPEMFIMFADDYNQFEHMEGLPSLALTDKDKRETARKSYENKIFKLATEEQRFEFKANTKYLYILQNRNNKDTLLDVLSREDSETNFKLFALMYLSAMERQLSQDDKSVINVEKEKILTKFKNQLETNSFTVSNNSDLRAYMMGVYLIFQNQLFGENIPEIVYNAFIVNKGDKNLANAAGFFARVDLFTVIHELTHVAVPKHGFYSKLVEDTVDEIISYITPNIFLSIVKLSSQAYSNLQTNYTVHQTDGIIDYVKMSKNMNVLYNLFSDRFGDRDLIQEEHVAPIAFLDLLFNAHRKIGKTVDWAELMEVIKNTDDEHLDQAYLFWLIIREYTEILAAKGKLSQQETRSLIKEMEKMQLWTLLTFDIFQNIKNTDSEIYKKILGNKSVISFEEKLLSNPAETKEQLKDFSDVIKSKEQLSRNDILTLLIIDVISNVDYEQLINNFDGVIEGIINTVKVAAQVFDMQKGTYSISEYEKISEYVTDNYYMAQNPIVDVMDNIFEFISNSLDKFFFAKLLINQVYGIEDFSDIMKNKKLLIVNSKQQEEILKQRLQEKNEDEIKDLHIENMKIVTMEIVTKPVTGMRSDSVLDVQRGIKVRYDNKENKLIVYPKKDINITPEEIQSLIMQEYFAERSEDIVTGDVIAFAADTDTTLNDISNRLKTAYTASVTMANKEQRFDLSSKPVSNIVTSCKQEFAATGVKTFTVNQEQAKKFAAEIKSLQEQGFRFVISCKFDNIADISVYDGLVIDATEIIDINQAKEFMESIKKKVLRQGVAKQISIEFNDKIYNQFDNLETNIIDKYGMTPVIDANSQSVNLKNIGKYEVRNVTENNIDNFLRSNNVIGLVIDNARALVGKKGILKQMFSKEHKYNKGYNAALNSDFSEFDYECSDVTKLKDILAIDINNDEQLKILENIDLYSLNLSPDSVTYLEYLHQKGNYEEMAGFIRGIAMNSARAQIIKGLGKGISLDMGKFAKEANGKYQKALLTVAVQLMMEDVNITELLETDFIESDMTAKEYFDSVLEKVNINIEEILKQNEYKIEGTKDKAKTIEDFKNYVVLFDNLKIVKETTSGLDMSIKAVRSMLSAA